jgi:hypothetical protein
MTTVQIHRLARREWSELPVALPVGAWFIGVSGELRVQADGSVEARPRPEHPWRRSSIAANPCATRTRP